MLPGWVVASLLVAAAPDAGPKPTGAAVFESGLPAQAKAALAGVRIPGVTEPVVDPTAKLPPELVAPWQIAMDFFSDIQHRDVDGALAFSRAPFSFDGHPATSPDEIRKGWSRYLNLPRSFHPVLYSLDVYPFDDMVKRYGAPPAKLAEIAFKGTMVAVANFDGRATIAVLRRDGAGPWRVCGFSD